MTRRKKHAWPTHPQWFYFERKTEVVAGYCCDGLDVSSEDCAPCACIHGTGEDRSDPILFAQVSGPARAQYLGLVQPHLRPRHGSGHSRFFLTKSLLVVMVVQLASGGLFFVCIGWFFWLTLLLCLLKHCCWCLLLLFVFFAGGSCKPSWCTGLPPCKSWSTCRDPGP